jgi:hypothetical protein
MTNTKKHFLTSAIGVIALAFSFAAQAENDLEGGWIVSSWESLGDESVAEP